MLLDLENFLFVHALAHSTPFDFRIDEAPPARLVRASRTVQPDFHQLITDHYAGLYRFARSLCKREGTAEDLVQQTFLQWARKGQTLRDIDKAKTWLYTTIYREWLAIARKEKRFQHVEFEPDFHGGVHEPMEIPQVDSQTLQRALGELDENFRAPLVLFYLRELSYKDIAETLGLPMGTVMSRLSRAKDALRMQLSAFADL